MRATLWQAPVPPLEQPLFETRSPGGITILLELLHGKTAGQIIVRRSAGLPFRPVYSEWFPNNPVQRAQGSYRREQDSPA